MELMYICVLILVLTIIILKIKEMLQNRAIKRIAKKEAYQLLETRNRDIAELGNTIQRYFDLQKDERCTEVIRKSDIVLKLLIMGGEYLFFPLKMRNDGKYYPRYDSNVVIDTEKKYGGGIISQLCMKAEGGLLRGESNQVICNSWGAAKDGKNNINSINVGYKKVVYLFSSLVSSGIIKQNDDVTKDAFNLLLWECAYSEIQRVNDLVDKTIANAYKDIESEGTNDQFEIVRFSRDVHIDNIDDNFMRQVYVLYELCDKNEDTIVFYLTAKLYKNHDRAIWQEIYKTTEKNVKAVLAEIEKRRYISNLLNNNNKIRLRMKDIDGMEPVVFEKLIEVLFHKMGYNTNLTRSTGDQGVDVVAEKKGRRIVIQAKCYSGMVGNSAVQEVAAGKQYYDAQDAYVVTNSLFTKSALELARANSVVLWDRNELSNMLERYCVYTSELYESNCV